MVSSFTAKIVLRLCLGGAASPRSSGALWRGGNKANHGEPAIELFGALMESPACIGCGVFHPWFAGIDIAVAFAIGGDQFGESGSVDVVIGFSRNDLIGSGAAWGAHRCVVPTGSVK